MKRQIIKINNELLKPREFGVWCAHCSIRIAPNEERIVMDTKTYHVRCYAKSKAVGGGGK